MDNENIGEVDLNIPPKDGENATEGEKPLERPAPESTPETPAEDSVA
jgi:hypothetical protein